MRVVTAAEMRRLDQLTIETHGVPSLRLMERAGQGVVDVILKRWNHLAKRGVLVVAGKGNNGGDGLVIARLLHEREFPCEVACMARAEDLSPDAAANLERYRAVKGRFTEVPPGDLDNLRRQMQDKGLLVDALLGTGLRSPVEGFPGGRGGAHECLGPSHHCRGYALGSGFRPGDAPGSDDPGRGHGDLRFPQDRAGDLPRRRLQRRPGGGRHRHPPAGGGRGGVLGGVAGPG